MSQDTKIDRDACLAAIQGQAVPDDLEQPIVRCSVIRGIRCHLEFAQSDRIKHLCSQYPEFARARNARLIMSNEIPEEMDDPALQPYCIWNPDFASQDTYRKLANRYPAMRYHVGRACAAAGYATLYHELDLLPDVSIAEEARESVQEGSKIIYEKIMVADARYAVMSDADRSVNPDNATTPAYLNGDTAVRWTLEVRRSVPDEVCGPEFFETDIEEDRRLPDSVEENDDDCYDSEYSSIEEARLLYTPLPADLPTIRKDLLIQMAAYEGNLDRYARLMRRNHMNDIELPCVIRGIFHHTMFARWWADQVQTNNHRIRVQSQPTERVLSSICEAINARRVMINEISSFNEDTQHLPHLIWYPLRPLEGTLKLLLERCPSMKHQIVIACIKCNYERLYKSIEPRPHPHFREAAEQSANTFYLQDLTTRATKLDISLASYSSELDKESNAIDPVLEPTREFCAHPIAPHMMRNSIALWGPYIGDRADSSIPELYVWQSEELLRKFERMYGPDTWYYDLEPTVASDDENEGTT